MSDYGKSSGQAQSTVARNFSASLNDVFGMDNSLEGLAQSVEQKKQAVTSQSQELEAIEARLRETEEKLRQKTSRPTSSSGKGMGSTTSHRRQPLASTFNAPDGHNGSPLAAQSPTSTSGFSSQGGTRWEGLLPQQDKRRGQ